MSLRKRLKDPWGMNSVLSQHRAVPMAPPQDSTRTIYTPAARAQQRRSSARLSGGRTYKSKG